jgi:hypothetical protein
LPRSSRFTLGERIDHLFVDFIELIFLAGYAARAQKAPLVARASTKLDTLKLFLRVASEIKSLDDRKYIALSKPLGEVGKMLGGWRKQVANASAEK